MHEVVEKFILNSALKTSRAEIAVLEILIQYILKKACVSVILTGSGWNPTTVSCEDGNES
jgi:hypothetical protein